MVIIMTIKITKIITIMKNTIQIQKVITVLVAIMKKIEVTE